MVDYFLVGLGEGEGGVGVEGGVVVVVVVVGGEGKIFGWVLEIFK